MSKLSGKFTLQELVDLNLESSEPIIENLIYDMDHVMLVGKEKSNKSTLALQICCHLSIGEPLFGQFNIPNPVDSVYIQAEGKITNTRANTINMTRVIPCDKSKVLLLFYPAIQLNKDDGLKKITDAIDSWRKPKLIVIDPLYQSMAGKIEEQESSSAMTANLRQLSERYQCAILLVHHAHRAKRGPEGTIIEEGDDSVFGSFVWKAFPDTVLLIQKVQGHKNHRKLSCDTSRMGNVVPELSLELIEPEPFYLKVRDNMHPIDEIVYSHLNGPTTIDRLWPLINKSRRHTTEALWRLQHKGKVKILNEGNKPMLWGRN